MTLKRREKLQVDYVITDLIDFNLKRMMRRRHSLMTNFPPHLCDRIGYDKDKRLKCLVIRQVLRQ